MNNNFGHLLFVYSYESLFVCFYILQFEELENLGYAGFAFSFFEDDVQTVSTSNCTSCFTPSVVAYLHALVVVGN